MTVLGLESSRLTFHNVTEKFCTLRLDMRVD